MKVLVILGHPRSSSFCGSMARAYAEGAREANMEVQVLDLGSLEFDPDVHSVSPRDQPLEPDLADAKRLIEWADHLAFVYPAWWGVGPARLKGFLDRLLLPGFAFREREDGSFQGLLGGKTAHLMTTMDMPEWVYRYLFRAPGHNAMKRSSLGLCGIATTRIRSIGPVKDSSAEERDSWLKEARAMGYSLRNGAHSRTGAVRYKLLAWLRALRLQFYPMTWMAYTVGALGAAAVTGEQDLQLYILGFLFLFFLEAATVFSNEWFDFESDKKNEYSGPFTGGSRVLIDQSLSFSELRKGIFLMLALAGGTAVLLILQLQGMAVPLMLLLITLFALGYTIPPLKLSWRGFGELDVGLTHSLGVLLIGFLLQGGEWYHPLPWLVSLPLFLSVLAAIILAGIPDMDADRQAGKTTVVVRYGRQQAALLSMVLVLASAGLIYGLSRIEILEGILHGFFPAILLHALILSYLLWRYRRRPARKRIDSLMAVSLSYIIWFGLVPLLNLL